ncbi:MAG: hypothetical protein AAB414_05490 [Patescibacteria group bacterium]
MKSYGGRITIDPPALKLRRTKKEKVPKENYFSTLKTEDFIYYSSAKSIPPLAGFFYPERLRQKVGGVEGLMSKEWWES